MTEYQIRARFFCFGFFRSSLPSTCLRHVRHGGDEPNVMTEKSGFPSAELSGGDSLAHKKRTLKT